MRCKALIIASVYLISMIPSIAIGGSPIKYSESITFPGCEFRVFFPTKIKKKNVLVNGI